MAYTVKEATSKAALETAVNAAITGDGLTPIGGVFVHETNERGAGDVWTKTVKFYQAMIDAV